MRIKKALLFCPQRKITASEKTTSKPFRALFSLRTIPAHWGQRREARDVWKAAKYLFEN